MIGGQGRGWPPWADFAALAAVFTALAWATWGAWPDVLVDFGRELYVAWRVAEGDVLYRDVASFYGPLSPYLNGLLFRVAGVGMRTLVVANLVLLAVATVMLHALLRRAGTSRPVAAVAGAAFLALFGFGHLIANGSFNFVCPYAHEATHGFVLGLGALLCALRAADEGRARSLRWAAAAGALGGLAFLTKPEPFLAAAGASVLVLVLAGHRGRSLAAGAGGLVLPPLAAFLLLAVALPAEEAARGTAGSWAYLGHAELREMGYFGWSAGLDRPLHHAGALLAGSALHAAVIVPAGALAWALGGRPRAARWAALAGAAVVAAALAAHWGSRAWLRAARPLPFWCAGLLAAGAAALWRGRAGAARPQLLARTALCAFALLLLPRILLNARFFHYGFTLAAVATVVVIAALLDWLPAALDRRGRAGVVLRAMAGVAVAFVMAWAVRDSRAFVSRKTVAVGRGADAFRADARGAYVNAAVENVPRASPEGALVVLPEGVMINYLLRRPSSIPYVTMLPSDQAQFGEDELLGSLQRRPPALIGLVHRTAEEFGTPLFGRDYASRTMQWIAARYAPAFTVGDPPLQPGSVFGLTVLARRPQDTGP